MQHKRFLFIFITLFSVTFLASGQKQINSPYSRFNLGSMEPSGSFRAMGMGGVGNSLRDNNSIYVNNPASYSSFDTVSFVFDFGLDYSMSFLTEGTSKYSSDDMNFDHLIMGFPIAKGWGVSTGILSLSNGYYRISEKITSADAGYDPMVGEYTAFHIGEGGFNNFFIGTGGNLNKHFSAGVNLKILLGQVKRSNQFVFDADYYNVYHNSSIEKLQLSGVNLEYGLQYTTPIKKDYFFNAGISLTGGKNYKSNYVHLSTRYTAYGSVTQDTLAYVSDDSTKAFIPASIKAGISFGKKNKFTAGLDFNYSKWGDSKIPGASGYTADSKSLLLGLEYIPDKFSNFSFFKRVEYRLGGHIADNYLIINGDQLKEVGASFGIGIPLRKTFSKANFFVDMTKKYGPAGSAFHNENYYTFGVSLNLYDYWFVKRKYE
jgi:hypothetical protein